MDGIAVGAMEMNWPLPLYWTPFEEEEEEEDIEEEVMMVECDE